MAASALSKIVFMMMGAFVDGKEPLGWTMMVMLALACCLVRSAQEPPYISLYLLSNP
jgi:hypothetical protein